MKRILFLLFAVAVFLAPVWASADVAPPFSFKRVTVSAGLAHQWDFAGDNTGSEFTEVGHEWAPRLNVGYTHGRIVSTVASYNYGLETHRGRLSVALMFNLYRGAAPAVTVATP